MVRGRYGLFAMQHRIAPHTHNEVASTDLLLRKPVSDEPNTLEDEYGCDPWDDENFGRHAASRGDTDTETFATMTMTWGPTGAPVEYEIPREEAPCSGCRETGMRPSHNGRRSCKSGSIASGGRTAHCSCATCF